MSQTEKEKQLVAAVKQDPQLFEVLYEQHYRTIFNYVLRRTGQFDASRDITSEVFLKALLKISKFKHKGISIAHWFYRIATNEVNLYYRSRKYRPQLLSDGHGIDLNEVADPASLTHEKEAAERRLADHEKFLKVLTVLRELPVKYQEVIALRYFEQMNIKQICEILQKKEGTVKSLLSRGLKQLKTKTEKTQP